MSLSRAGAACRRRPASTGPTLHPRDVTTHKGIPVTTIARMLVDLTDVLNAVRPGERDPRGGVQSTGSANEPRETRWRRRTGATTSRVLERALELTRRGSAGLKSRDEAAFLSMLKDLPEPLVNTKLHGIEVDFHWPAYKLVVEVDGPGHGRPRTKRDDERKQAILRAAGYAVIRSARQRSASRSSGTSVTNMCPGACVIISSGRLAAATACGVTPHAQNTGTSPSRISTGSPY